ncbi:MAG: sigma 54-interacting transcriptional regulator [Labilithrix sp.]|nr:sigma 54-interacting transcriptional regulator [Labilithrix sp.]
MTPSSVSAGFAELDDRLFEGRPGVIVVVAPPDLQAAALAHVARRLRAGGALPVEAAPRAGAPLFREIATQLAAGPLTTDPPACADAIAEIALRRRAAIVAPLPAEGTWDFEVASELARVPGLLLVFATSSASVRDPAWGASVFELGRGLHGEDRLRWFAAAAHEAQSRVEGTDLASLEAWWRGACRQVAPAAPFDVSPRARELLVLLALVGRSVPREALGARAVDVEALADASAVATTATHVAIDAGLDAAALEATASSALRVEAAEMMGGTGFEPCPWLYARAAELLLAAGDVDAADAMMTKATRRADDARAALEITARWQAALAPLDGGAGFTLRVRAAERALASGEAHEAQRWCESLSAIRPGSPEVGLLMGRSLLQLGDVVAARVALSRAMAAATDPETRAQICGAIAEVGYVAGDLRQATEQAERSIEMSKTASSRLEGRNILGKIHLAAARWEEADEHFAQDAFTAREHGDVTAELRARLNRAIAMMSRGRLEDARAMLERVLEEGAAHGEDRARSYAMRNLAVIAYRQHDYGRALALWDAAVSFPSALCGRITAAFTLANLADLRVRLGLVDHAEHTLAFGRRVLGGHAAPATLANFAVVSARVALARGDVVLAKREADLAMANAEAAGDRGDRLPDAYLVAARVSLEDGDVHRAGELVEKARGIASNDRLRAEVSIVAALHCRAAGKPALEVAMTALAMARAADEEDLLAETHALLAMVHRDLGDAASSEAHCRWALGIRDQVAGGLPPEIRAAYLAKPEIVALSRLASALAGDKDDDADHDVEEPAVAARVSSAPPASPRVIVGDDPRIRSLLLAIRKVARSNSTVLIRGESGTGKELVAAALHRESHRAKGPLVSVNCAALVETLLLSELFGHEKGAFTGAGSRKRGRFEMADGGTLFLDEIGDISPRTQVALLRVLQEKTFERVGGTTPIRADVRIICATHRDLKAMVERGEFRDDLYYRLQGVTLEVPALRDRIRDLPKIAEHLLARIATERPDAPASLSPEAIELLVRHRWPGNVRELENVLRASSVFAEGSEITLADIVENVADLRALAGQGLQGPISLRSAGPARVEDADPVPEAPPPPPTEIVYAHVRRGTVSLSDIKRQIEQDCITRALSETGGNITRAAVLLGMKRPRLSQLAKQYGLSGSSDQGLEAEDVDVEVGEESA